MMQYPLYTLLLLLVVFLASAIKILREYERRSAFRLSEAVE